jgi:hypothetical protein
MATILIDFDGTCIPTLPLGGYSDYNTGAEKVLKRLVNEGHQLVLWTVRNDSKNNPYNIAAKQFIGKNSLDEAVDWFKERDIPLFGINQVPGEIDVVGEGRKILGDFLIDDTAIGTPLKYVKIQYYSYITGIEQEIETYHVDWELVEKLLIKLNLL